MSVEDGISQLIQVSRLYYPHKCQHAHSLDGDELCPLALAAVYNLEATSSRRTPPLNLRECRRAKCPLMEEVIDLYQSACDIIDSEKLYISQVSNIVNRLFNR